MNHALLESLPRPLHEAVESAGYRVRRWISARQVLQTRVTKGRLGGELGTFLMRWLPEGTPLVSAESFALDLCADSARVTITGGESTVATSPEEHALLHLPALRSFWSNELRLQHFVALKSLVPQTWLRDDTPVPNGAVIAGLGVTRWDQPGLVNNQDYEIRERLIIRRTTAKPNLSARYISDGSGRTLLTSLEALS